MKYTSVIAMFIIAVSCAPGIQSNLVEVGSVYGFITNEAHLPLDSVRVDVAGEASYTGYTNSAGYYQLPDLGTGTYNIIFTRDGFQSFKRSVRVKADAKTEINIALTAEESAPGRITGVVVNYPSNTPLIVDVVIPDKKLATVSDTDGSFEFDSLAPGKYLVKYQSMEYLDAYSEANVLPGQTTELMKSMIRANTPISLYGIQFEFGKATIKPESYPTLDSAAGILSNYPEVEVEIQGHTDSVGSEGANQTLSQKRAEAVRQYLIDVHMIEPVRLIAYGFGETKPVADNKTAEGRAKNRRVDFLITK